MQGIKNVPLYCLICNVPPPSRNGHESVNVNSLSIYFFLKSKILPIYPFLLKVLNTRFSSEYSPII